MKIAIVSIMLLLFAVIMLGVKVFFTKNGKFPSGHVHNIPALKNKGVGCAVHNTNKK